MHDCEFCGNEIDYHEIIDCITCALDAEIHIQQVTRNGLVIWH